MELAQLLSAAGEWNKVWLAVHWDRKLKKADYIDTDLCALVKSILLKRSILSLRTVGHLLVGICKIYAKKCELFEAEALETRTRLMMAFWSDGDKKDGDGQDGDDKDGADGVFAALGEVNPELTGPADASTLLRGKRHVARLEDITLKTPAKKAAPPRGDDDLFGAICEAELRAALREQLPMEPFPTPQDPGVDFETQPLVGLQREEGDAAAAGAHPVEAAPEHPLAARDGAVAEGPGDPADAVDAVGAVGEDKHADADGPAGEQAAGPVKRRRRAFFICDETTEIPKEIYQGYVNDRSAITRKNLLDYTVFLPHYSPNLPNFMTTFTDISPLLCESLRWGTEVAEKRRRLAQEAEFNVLGDGYRPPTLPTPVGVVPPPPSPLDLLGHGADLAPPPGPLEAQAAGAPAAAPATPKLVPPAGGSSELVSERALLEDAPRSLSAVVTASMDEEDQSQNTAVRVGYSGRTEKMHRFLAKEFHGTQSRSLSYETMCREQSAGRRELIAGCFFELLVLKSNGVIGLSQDAPLADIQISKAAQWAK
eukprot:CAMPEP_0179371468 /NCGR_PEP_ID=MMETSP0797-20121207/85741_1 /TAXON_ID=47934 /ORGANISM="Dinophysis acuminata, Strain DAEP01" /LENGTH=539 /DNA_ID=CAMNT_0021087321 /DNA_START=67 /DNA_END=1687 /DNA_ORIENTATION=+